MENKKRTNYWLIAGVLVILMVGSYYSYRKDLVVRKNGIYTIAKIEKIRIARSGWRVGILIAYQNAYFHEEAVYFYEYFNSNSVGNSYFIKINYKEQENKIESMRLVPIVQVPDSIQSAPPEGWSEEWMREHFPKVVEYVHDTR